MILKGYCTSIKSDIILFYPLDSDLEDFVTSMNMFIIYFAANGRRY